MDNVLTDILLDCSAKDFSDVSAELKDYCKDAMLIRSGSDTFALLSADELDGFIEYFSDNADAAAKRQLYANAFEIDSFCDFVGLLQGFAKHRRDKLFRIA